jgi:hypothetical protein
MVTLRSVTRKGYASRADVADHTVLTYDPRGISRRTLTGPAGDDTPNTRAEDVRGLIEAMGGGRSTCSVAAEER